MRRAPGTHGQAVRVFHSAAPHASDRYRADLADWLAALPKPAAVMLAGDYHAPDLPVACAMAALTIPFDVAVLGVDNDPALCEAIAPPLSSIELPFEEEGFEAARTLDKMMREKKPSLRPRLVRFPPKRVLERASTSFVPPGSHLVDRAEAFIAAHLGVSPALLALRFRQRTHTTVREAIIRARLKEVEKLLSSTQQPVARIARSCGFSTANRLTHLFTARYGLSPRAWRAR